MKIFLTLLAVCLSLAGQAQDTVIASGSILFHSGQYRARPSDCAELKEQMNFSAIDSPLYVLIEGHSDSVGNYARNKLLSMRRALSVQRWLINQGVAKADITVRAWGPDKPVADNRTAEGRRRNRRVDLVFSRPRLIAASQEEAPAIAELYAQLATPLQRFCINPSRDTVIRCSQGTVIYIKAGSLVAPPGCDNSCITFHVREDFLPSDMLLDNLSTTSDGHIIETQGMVYTEAMDCHGNKLGLQEGRDLVIALPTDSINPNVKVFDGARNRDSVMNWTVDDSSKLSSFALKDIVACGDWFDDIKTEVASGRCPFFFCRIGRPVRLIKAAFGVKPRSRKIASPQRPLTFFSQVKGVGCPELERLFKEYGVDDIESLALAINRPLLDSFKVTTMAQLRDTLAKIRTRTIELDYMKKRVSFDDFKYYIFNTPKLGWKNVDCFSDVSSRKRVTVKVDLAAQPDIACKLALKDRRAMLSADSEGDKFIFLGVPKGERAVIVAIQYKDGKPLLAMKEIVISEGPFDLEWKSLSIEELRQELKKLDR